MTSPPPNGDQDVEDVLRNAGRRSGPPDDVVQSVRAAVEAQWRDTVAQRSQRRRRIGLSLAAGFAIAAVALWGMRPLLLGSPGEPMASVSVVAGSAQVKSGWLGRWRPVETRQALRVGEQVETASSGRLALTLGDHLSVRLDHDTAVSLVDGGHIAISRGALYVDSGSQGQLLGPALQIVTPAGAIHHVGTQYQARVTGSEVRVTVREGKVELDTEAGASHRAAAGEQITVSTAGTVLRSAILPYEDGTWGWVSATAPPFDIDGRSVGDFLTWAGRELGCDVVYADSQTQSEASRVLLSGSISGLSPGDALTAVLPTTPLRGEVRGGRLLVSLSPASR